MARETFEDQAAAVRRVLNGKPSKTDRKHLECAARNLDAFGAFRQKVIDMAETGALDAEADTVAEEVLKLLHIPAGE